MSNPKFVRNEVTYITNEIDYDKLAEAIVKANKRNDDIIEESKTKSKQSFWKSVWLIITNKKDTNGNMTLFTFSSLVSIVFNISALIGVFVSVLLGYAFVNYLMQFVNSMPMTIDVLIIRIIVMVIILVLIMTCLVFSLIFRGAANEMDKEKDKNFVIAVFSGVTCFAALVVSLVTLFKG